MKEFKENYRSDYSYHSIQVERAVKSASKAVSDKFSDKDRACALLDQVYACHSMLATITKTENSREQTSLLD